MSKNKFFGLLYLACLSAGAGAMSLGSCNSTPEVIYEYRGTTYETAGEMRDAMCTHGDSVTTVAEKYANKSDSLMKKRQIDLASKYRDTSIMYLGQAKRILSGIKSCN